MNIRCPPNTLQIFSECLMQTKPFQTHCVSQFQIYKVTSLQFRMLLVGLIIYNVSNMGQIQNTFFIKSQLKYIVSNVGNFFHQISARVFLKDGNFIYQISAEVCLKYGLSSSNLSLSMNLSSLNLSLSISQIWNFLHRISAQVCLKYGTFFIKSQRKYVSNMELAS